MNSRNTQPPVKRWETGIRMATVIVVLGTMAAVWHPGRNAPSTAVDDGAATSAPSAARSADSDYFPSRFPAPENIEPQAPTF